MKREVGSGTGEAGTEQQPVAPPEQLESGEPPQLSRRRALQILGAMPVAAALGAQQPTTPLTPGVTSQVPSKTTVGAQKAPRFFNAHEWATVAMLADYVIPRDDRSGSATDAKVPEYMDFLLTEKDANVNTQIAFHGGLAWIDNECRKRFQKRSSRPPTRSDGRCSTTSRIRKKPSRK
jgi:hypothetical protein